MITALTKGNIKAAIKTLRRNKGRSALTMLGVIIGVASVVTAVSIGEGVKREVNIQTEHLGKDLITIRPGQTPSNSTSGELTNLRSLLAIGFGGSLGSRDVEVSSKALGVASAVPLSIVSGGVVSDETHQHSGALVIGTTEGLPRILNQGLAYGEFLGQDTSSMSDKVVLGSRVAQELFTEDVPLGQTLTILGHQFVVVGIFNDFQTTPFSGDVDFNNAVFISYDTARAITNGNSPIYEILARPEYASQTSVVVGRLWSGLLAAHGGQHDFTVLEQGQSLPATTSILDLLTALVGGVAAISLVVGGIGIMNVMLVSITERMHEVGIRKAVGATNRQILSQFITEAAVLSVSGGIAGILLSLFVVICFRIFTSFTPVITWQIVVLAFGVSVGIGVLFGSVPALQAARRAPIDALRNE